MSRRLADAVAAQAVAAVPVVEREPVVAEGVLTVRDAVVEAAAVAAPPK